MGKAFEKVPFPFPGNGAFILSIRRILVVKTAFPWAKIGVSIAQKGHFFKKSSKKFWSVTKFSYFCGYIMRDILNYLIKNNYIK
jgi:hypothetical protein